MQREGLEHGICSPLGLKNKMSTWGTEKTAGVTKEIQATRQMKPKVAFASGLVEHVTNEQARGKIWDW